MGKSIYLINAGNDEKYKHGVAHGTSFPPLGVISLGTAVQNRTDWNVRVLDGLITDERGIIQDIEQARPTVVGVSVLSTSYQSALNIARAGKRVGATTIFGNDQAAITGKNMLLTRLEIDYVCTADSGETPLIHFLEYLEGKRDISNVAKLMYRKSEEIKHNDLPELAPADRFAILDQIEIPNRALIPKEVREKYLENYQATYPDEGVTGTGTINRFRGCPRAKNRCCYCGIADLTIRASSPRMFWDDVRAAREMEINRLFEAGDSVSGAQKYLEQILAAKPDRLDWGAFVYTSARETNQKLVELYKKLGVFRANMGLDSGDDLMLKRLKGKKDSVKQNQRAVKLLSDIGIRVYASFVLGGPGETRDSVENTVKFARWLIDNALVDGTEAQPLFPELNAKTGRMLLNPEYALKNAESEGWRIRNRDLLYELPKKWEEHENPDPIEISQDWATVFSEVPYEELLTIAANIRDYSKLRGVATGSSWIMGG
ncbi:MAG: radical SAM protein [Nanoarchaeota archaeon]|nr:radical SAM protein [Nanoarchaeota archaeon]